VAYIGRKCHGMYYDPHKGNSQTCLYFQDSREPPADGSTIVNAWNNLKEISPDAYGFGFNGNFGDHAGKGPLYRNRKYWEYETCKGTATRAQAINSLFSLPQSGCKANDYTQSLKIGNIPN